MEKFLNTILGYQFALLILSRVNFKDYNDNQLLIKLRRLRNYMFELQCNDLARGRNWVGFGNTRALENMSPNIRCTGLMSNKEPEVGQMIFSF